MLSLRNSGRNRTDGVSHYTNGPVLQPLALGRADDGVDGDDGGDGAPPRQLMCALSYYPGLAAHPWWRGGGGEDAGVFDWLDGLMAALPNMRAELADALPQVRSKGDCAGMGASHRLLRPGRDVYV